MSPNNLPSCVRCGGSVEVRSVPLTGATVEECDSCGYVVPVRRRTVAELEEEEKRRLEALQKELRSMQQTFQEEHEAHLTRQRKENPSGRRRRGRPPNPGRWAK